MSASNINLALNLSRFLQAQESSYQTALLEIKAGKKRSHWMWYIFPQIAGLGRSSTAQFYAIQNLAEATSYLQHPILGTRLKEICHALLQLKTNNPVVIFGEIDSLKLRSSMTLFNLVAENEPIFLNVLEKFFQGLQDQKTLAICQQIKI